METPLFTEREISLLLASLTNEQTRLNTLIGTGACDRDPNVMERVTGRLTELGVLRQKLLQLTGSERR